jgi:hypothetical protein
MLIVAEIKYIGDRIFAMFPTPLTYTRKMERIANGRVNARGK